MEPATIAQIEEQLRRLPEDKLSVVLDFVSYLAERQHLSGEHLPEMLAAETALRKDWDRPEEDAAWANL